MSEPEPGDHLRLLKIIALLTVVLALLGPIRQITKPGPIHAWEAGLVVDAFRLTQGLPAYELPETGHATHMYGPLSTWTLAQVFRVTGPHLLVARVMAFLAALGSILLLVRATRRPGQRVLPVLAGVILLGWGRVVTDYVEPRPDLIALLLMLCSLVALYRGLTRDHLGWHALGLLALALGFLFKQPAAMVCAIPMTAFVLDPNREVTPRRLAMLATPWLVVLGLIAAFRLGWPIVFHYTIEVPKQYRIDTEVAVRYFVWTLASMPLTWLALGVWLRQEREPEPDPQLPWVLAAILVATPAGAIAAGKIGGVSNSLLPAAFAWVALLLRTGDPLEQSLARWRGDRDRGARLGALAALLAALSVLSTHADAPGGGTDYTLGDPAYPRVLAVVRQLEGPVACFQDPTIPLFTQQRATRNLVLEYDAAGWPDSFPAYFFEDLKTARHVVTIGDPASHLNWPLSKGEKEALLTKLGFRRQEVPELEGTVYALWSRPAK